MRFSLCQKHPTASSVFWFILLGVYNTGGWQSSAQHSLLIAVVSVDAAYPVLHRHHQSHWVDCGCESLEHRNCITVLFLRIHSATFRLIGVAVRHLFRYLTWCRLPDFLLCRFSRRGCIHICEIVTRAQISPVRAIACVHLTNKEKRCSEAVSRALSLKWNPFQIKYACYCCYEYSLVI